MYVSVRDVIVTVLRNGYIYIYIYISWCHGYINSNRCSNPG